MIYEIDFFLNVFIQDHLSTVVTLYGHNGGCVLNHVEWDINLELVLALILSQRMEVKVAFNKDSEHQLKQSIAILINVQVS